MNLIDREFVVSAEEADAAPLNRARRRRRRIAVGIAVALTVAAAASFYVWATTLCGDCGGPSLLPPPPA